MPTKPQIQIVQIARKQCGLNEAEYRMILWNVAGVTSTTRLHNTSVEDVMDIMESKGFVDRDHGPGYWGNKVQRRSQVANERMLRKIEAMAAETAYPVEAMVYRMTKHRTNHAEELCPREAWMLIEAYKAIIDRARDTPYGEAEAKCPF